MSDREKLIELIGQVQYLGGLELALADHLLANGVTFHKWIPVSERLPDELPHSAVVWSYLVRPSADVLVLRKNNEMEVAWYSHANGWWTTPDEMFTFRGVTHWMPLPNPPEGGLHDAGT